MLHYFAELKSSYNLLESEQELFIIINKQIRIDGQIIFHEGWFNRNVIQDLSTTDCKFLSHAEFVRKYYLHFNFLTYMKVVSVIPQSLIDRARAQSIDKSTFFSAGEFQLITMNLLKMKNRDYHWFLIRNSRYKHTLKETEKWQRDLQPHRD